MMTRFGARVLVGDARARSGDPEAVVDVVMRSTRHVVATTLTTMAGFAPLILGGGGFWPPLAVAIAGGVGGATLLGLYFGPAAYTLLMCRGTCTARGTDKNRTPTERPKIKPESVVVAAAQGAGRPHGTRRLVLRASGKHNACRLEAG